MMWFRLEQFWTVLKSKTIDKPTIVGNEGASTTGFLTRNFSKPYKHGYIGNPVKLNFNRRYWRWNWICIVSAPAYIPGLHFSAILQHDTTTMYGNLARLAARSSNTLAIFLWPAQFRRINEVYTASKNVQDRSIWCGNVWILLHLLSSPRNAPQ